MELLSSGLFFWFVWLLAPIFRELLPAIGTYALLDKNKKPKLDIPPTLFPEITILIPVHNCEDTLEHCLSSINACSYQNSLLSILLLDSGCSDHTYDVFQQCQLNYDISMHWLSTSDSKARALNKGIFNSQGKYIINVDSIGYFEHDALKNLVTRFENDRTIDCLTGVVLPYKEDINDKASLRIRFIRKFDYLEFCHSFFVGKNYKNSPNNLQTVSVPYCAFKKSALLSTFLYDTNSLIESSHITAQLSAQNLNVRLCERSIFYIPPTNSLRESMVNKQRWKMNELSIFHKKLKNNKKPKTVSTLMNNSFLVFWIIWYLLLLVYTYVYGLMDLIGIAIVITYQIYLFSNILYSVNVMSYLDEFKQEKSFYYRLIGYILLQPIYKFIIYPLRFCKQKNKKEKNDVKKNISV